MAIEKMGDVAGQAVTQKLQDNMNSLSRAKDAASSSSVAPEAALGALNSIHGKLSDMNNLAQQSAASGASAASQGDTLSGLLSEAQSLTGQANAASRDSLANVMNMIKDAGGNIDTAKAREVIYAARENLNAFQGEVYAQNQATSAANSAGATGMIANGTEGGGNKIQNEAASAMLASANSTPSDVLSLLR